MHLDTLEALRSANTRQDEVAAVIGGPPHALASFAFARRLCSAGARLDSRGRRRRGYRRREAPSACPWSQPRLHSDIIINARSKMLCFQQQHDVRTIGKRTHWLLSPQVIANTHLAKLPPEAKHLALELLQGGICHCWEILPFFERLELLGIPHNLQ